MKLIPSEAREIQDEDLPALHRAASRASLKAQRRYMRLFVINLLLLIFGAFLSGVSFILALPAFVAILSGLFFVTGIIITSAMGVKRYEKDWYGGRAIAESVKTLAWRYMAGAEPYESTLPPKEIDEKFATDLLAVLSARKYLSGALDGHLSNRPQITKKMREVRALPTEDRRDFYAKARIEGQREWYAQEAETNQDKEWNWFWAIVVTQLLAAASAFAFVRWPEFPVRMVGTFAILATAAIAWLQVKRHQELAQSYSLAAQELGLIAVKATHIKTDEELSKFVGDAENAISREHTMWVARRDQT